MRFLWPPGEWPSDWVCGAGRRPGGWAAWPLCGVVEGGGGLAGRRVGGWVNCVLGLPGIRVGGDAVGGSLANSRGGRAARIVVWRVIGSVEARTGGHVDACLTCRQACTPRSWSVPRFRVRKRPFSARLAAMPHLHLQWELGNQKIFRFSRWGSLRPEALALIFPHNNAPRARRAPPAALRARRAWRAPRFAPLRHAPRATRRAPRGW